VAAKWLAPEPDSPQAEALRDDEVLIVPNRVYAAVGNIRWKQSLRDEMDSGIAQVGARWVAQVPLHMHDSTGLPADTATGASGS
jgi:hypothetical protein